MQLTLPERFLLLAIHYDKPIFLVTQPAFSAGFIGSIFMELAVREHIHIENKVVEVISGKPGSGVVLEVLSNLAQSKPRKIRTWVSRLSNSSRRYRLKLINEMQHKGLMRTEERRFLFIPYKVPKLINKKAKQDEVTNIRKLVFQNGTPTEADMSLLGLVYACRMHGIIAKNSAERKEIRKRIKTMLKDDPIAKSVNEVIKETQAAIMAAVVATSAASSAASS